MLLQFSVENFRSFKERAVLSMEASKDTVHPDHIVTMGKERLLKTAAIFGANASGKSNLFLALTAAILAIRQSNERQVGELLPMIVPFKFSEETIQKPSLFEFVFLAEGKKYVYGFSATREKIIKEYLYVYKTARASTIFERDSTKTPEYRFTDASVRRELEPLVKRNTENKLFLATATSWNAQVTKVPLQWFYSKIDTYPNNYDSLIPKDVEMIEKDEGDVLKRFILHMLKEADINIQNYEYESHKESVEKLFERFPAPARFMIPPTIANGPLKAFSIRTLHAVQENGKEEQKFWLDLKEESQGTKSLFMLSPVLFDAFHQGKVICVDEFDVSMHPILVSFLAGVFQDPDINMANAQLIVSLHTTALMSRELSRDDEIYFTNKDKQTGQSELYSLSDFSYRKNRDIRKAYLLGRFGAVPDIGDGDILW